jgi:uncharacterized protein DUF4154
MAPLSRLLRRTLFAAAVFALPLAAAAAEPATEYQVKAAYLFNFGQFVEWPRDAFASADAPFVIGVLGDDPVGDVIDDMVRGESLGRHPLAVRRFARVEDVAGCNILFIGRGEAPRLERLLQTLHGRHILTVTDVAGSEGRAAMIVLLTENNRVRMRINVAEARASDLVISSKLLRPAEIVGNLP